MVLHILAKAAAYNVRRITPHNIIPYHILIETMTWDSYFSCVVVVVWAKNEREQEITAWFRRALYFRKFNNFRQFYISDIADIASLKCIFDAGLATERN